MVARTRPGRQATPERPRLTVGGVFISCTAFKTIGVIATLEQDLGKPVVSANQASFWDCLRTAGLADRITGYGRLFDLPSPDPIG